MRISQINLHSNLICVSDIRCFLPRTGSGEGSTVSLHKNKKGTVSWTVRKRGPMKKFFKEYVVKNWYPILVILVGVLMYAGVFNLENTFLFPGSWALLLVVFGLIYLKTNGMTSLTMIGIAFGVFLLIAAYDYVQNPEAGAGMIGSSLTPLFLVLVGVGSIMENVIKKHTIIRK